MAFEIRPYPEWSWSQSREQTFSECARKYYYHYYESHNGWLKDAPPRARAAYRLKQMTNLYLMLGDAVHQMAETAIKQWQQGKVLPDEREVFGRIRDRLNQAYLDSRRREQWSAAPKKSIMLHEIYYDHRLPERRVQQIKERMAVCVRQFLASASLRELTGRAGRTGGADTEVAAGAQGARSGANAEVIGPRTQGAGTGADLEVIGSSMQGAGSGVRVVEVEELNTFLIEDEKIYVKLDLLYRSKDDTWVIVDWKTGQETEKNEQQVLLYALFLHDKYQVPYDRIEIRIEYLLSGDFVSVTVRPEDIERVKREVLASAKAMKAYLEDPAENKPKPAVAFPASPESRKCGGCNYREICDAKVI